ncbi:flagellar basal body protein, partial [Methylobacterium gregans]
MSGIYLFDLASMQARHLAVRQATIAGNVANANTPDYKARDVTPFAQILARTSFEMAQTASTHVGDRGGFVRTVEAKDGWDVLETASGVTLEQELLKAGT